MGFAALSPLAKPGIGNNRTVGRESEAHPAFRIIPSPDAEQHHLRPRMVINTALIANRRDAFHFPALRLPLTAYCSLLLR